MAFEIHSVHEDVTHDKKNILMQSITAAGSNSVADPDTGFDEKASYEETRGWHADPDRVAFIGSMGRRAGDERFQDTALKSEGIKPASAKEAFMVEVDGTAFTIEEDTPLSVYAGVEFDPSIRATISFDTHVDAEKALDEITDGQAAWVRITIPVEDGAFASVKNRSVPGFDKTIPLKELGGAQTVFAAEHQKQGVTFEGYYIPRGAADPADGIYYGLQEGSPGFLHVHNLPSDIGEQGALERHNANIRDANAGREDEAPYSIGGHALAIAEAENAIIEIMPIDAALVKVGINNEGKTIMRPFVENRHLETEAAVVEDVQADVRALGLDLELTPEQLDMILNQYILDRDAALKVAAGNVVSSLSPEILEALGGRVEVMTPRDIQEEHLPYFDLG